MNQREKRVSLLKRQSDLHLHYPHIHSIDVTEFIDEQRTPDQTVWFCRLVCAFAVLNLCIIAINKIQDTTD